MATEKLYHKSLEAFLRERAPNAKSERIYGHDATNADLYLAWKGIITKSEVFFEVKRNLSKKSELDRLIGRIELLRSGKQRITVVVCGEVDEGYVARLRELQESDQ